MLGRLTHGHINSHCAVVAVGSKYISVFVSQWSGGGSQGYERDLLADNQTLIHQHWGKGKIFMGK